MALTQPLGGTRQSSPVEDEMTYPLTGEEFLLIKDNLLFEKFTNWESFLLTTGFTFLITTIVSVVSRSFYDQKVVDKIVTTQLNISQISVVAVYSVISIASFLSFFAFRSSKKTSKKSISRLENRISSHLNLSNNG